MGLDHPRPLCRIALHALLGPVHVGFHVLAVMGPSSTGYGRLGSSGESLPSLEFGRPSPGDTFWHAARGAGVPPERLCVVDGLPNPAFTGPQPFHVVTLGHVVSCLQDYTERHWERCATASRRTPGSRSS